MRLFALFVSILFVGHVVSAQEVSTEVTEIPPTFSSILTQTGQSAESILEGIRVRLLDELRVQSDAAQRTHLETPYAPIIDAVFGTTGLSGEVVQVPSGACIPFTESFQLGDSGDEVLRIQKFLNAHAPETRVAQDGAGSPGNETTYYGARTVAAVQVLQQKYAADILAPLNLTVATGYWGASTRAKVNMLMQCAGTVDF